MMGFEVDEPSSGLSQSNVRRNGFTLKKREKYQTPFHAELWKMSWENCFFHFGCYGNPCQTILPYVGCTGDA